MGVALLLVGCVPGHEVVVTPPTVVIVGFLSGGQAAGYDCLWLTAVGKRRELIIPSGWSAKQSPARLFDSTGKQVAVAGNTIRVTGPGDIAGQSVCSPDPPVVATHIDNLTSP
jgi:hypothetical protein